MNALDDFCSTRDTLAVGAGEQLHDGGIYTYFDRDCHCCGPDQDHPGEKVF